MLDAVERVERAVKDDVALAARLAAIDYGVEEVPPEAALAAAEAGTGPLALARTDEASPGEPARIVLYRRPLEVRSPDLAEREAIVHEVVVDRLAELLGVPVDRLDPPPE